MLRYVGKRILMLIPVMLGVSLIVFCMIYFTPGDPAEYMLGVDATPEAVQAMRETLGLNGSFLEQYGRYLYKIVTRFDFGTSYSTHRSVTTEILDRFPNTFRLALLSMVVSAILGIILGIISATKQYTIFDNMASAFALIGTSMPSFWFGLMLIIWFCLKLKWFPPSGFDTPAQWVLPTICLGLGSTATVTRQTRSSMLEVIRQDYIVTARAKGQLESVVVMKHGLKNAMMPIITVIGNSFGVHLGGAMLTETVFSIPGIGKMMVDAIAIKNYPVVQGGVLFIALCSSIVNLLVDLLYAYIDPRIKAQYSKKKVKKPAAAQKAKGVA